MMNKSRQFRRFCQDRLALLLTSCLDPPELEKLLRWWKLSNRYRSGCCLIDLFLTLSLSPFPFSKADAGICNPKMVKLWTPFRNSFLVRRKFTRSPDLKLTVTSFHSLLSCSDTHTDWLECHSCVCAWKQCRWPASRTFIVSCWQKQVI